MRVLLSTDAVGGVWDYSATLAAGLAERGADVLLAIIGPDAPLRERAVPPGVEIARADYRLEWMPGADADVDRAAEWLSGLQQSWGAEVVHLNQMAYSARSFAVPTVVVTHSDAVSWFSEVRGTAPPEEWSAYGARVREGLAGATVVVSPSRYQSDLLQRGFGRDADQVIHNGSAAPGGPIPRVREPLLMAAGRAWDEGKGMDVLDAALVLLGSSAPPTHLFGATSGPSGENIQPRRLICHDHVDRDRLSGWMSRASAFVAPSRYEPFGLAPLEAALHGCPLVLSDIGSFRELWSGCATFFRCGQSESLADAIAAVLDDAGSAAERAAAARERALHQYGAEQMLDRYLNLYRRLTGATIDEPIMVQSCRSARRSPIRTHQGR